MSEIQTAIDQRKDRFMGTFMSILSPTVIALNSIFWSAAKNTSGFEVFSFRMVFAFLTISLMAAFSKPLRVGIKKILTDKHTFLLCVGFGLAMAGRLCAYFWTVMQTDLYMDLSFASFVAPVMQMTLASIILKEKMSKGAIAALVLAIAAIVYLAIVKRTIPFLAIIFGLLSTVYLVFKRQVKGTPFALLWTENLVALPLCIGILTYIGLTAGLGSVKYSADRMYLLLGSLIALLSFYSLTVSVQKASIPTMCFCFYIEPSILFFLGLFLYNNKLDTQMLLAFIIIWVALCIYAISAVRDSKKQLREALVENVNG